VTSLFYEPVTNQVFMTGASGVRIGTRHVLTVGHAMHFLFARLDIASQQVISWPVLKSRAAIISFGRDGTAQPFVPLFVRLAQGGRALGTPAGFVRSLRPPADLSCLTECPQAGAHCIACEGTFDAPLDFALLRFGISDYVNPSGAIPANYWESPKTSRIDASIDGLVLDDYASTAGYPRDKPCQQWESGGFVGDDSGDITQLLPVFSGHTVPGNSGGPVWRETSARVDGVARTRFDLVGIAQGMYKQAPELEFPRSIVLLLHRIWPTVRRWMA